MKRITRLLAAPPARARWGAAIGTGALLVSGVLLFLSLPLALYAFEQSLRGPETFEQLQQLFAHPLVRIVLLLLVWALAHHLFAGIRHLLMDLHWGVNLHAARRSALAVAVAGGLVAVFSAWGLFA